MPSIDQTIVQAAQNFSEICRKLKVTVVAPFQLSTEPPITCIAFLPHFGGPKGMVIGTFDLPEILPQDEVKQLAHEKSLYFSFVNASAWASNRLNDTVVKEVLEDCGYYGLRASRPDWFAGYDHSTS